MSDPTTSALEHISAERDRLRAQVVTLQDELELAWGLIANAGGGDWSKESPAWRQAAERWRDRVVLRKPPAAEPGVTPSK